MKKILSVRGTYRSGADPDDMKKLKDLARAIALGQMRAATREVPQVSRHHMPVCVGTVAPSENLFAFEIAIRALAWPRSDTYGLPLHVGVHVIASADDCKRAEKDGFWLRERLFVLVPARRFLPQGFEATADLVVEIGPPSPRLVAGAARRCLGIHLSDAEAEEAASYPLDALTKAFRLGRKRDRAVKALRDMTSGAGTSAAMSAGPTLDDLPGMGEAAGWGRRLDLDLKDWKAGNIRWEDVDRGVLVSGPPGCGKTSFATALANSCGVSLVLGSLAMWQSKGHLGDLLRAMRGAFAEAIEKAPSVLFIDEVDSFGDRARMSETTRNEQYCREVVNGLLECLDGAAGREGVVVVGATNYPDAIDAGIRRPGRLDRHIVIPLPDEVSRASILQLHLATEMDTGALRGVAARTAGWSGAALEQLARDARRSARRHRRSVTAADIYGSLPPLVSLPDVVRRRASVHEAGHALVGMALGRTVLDVSVKTHVEEVEMTVLGGVTTFAEAKTLIRSATWFRDRIATLLAGSCAEELVFGDRSTGAGGQPGSDLHLATMATLTIEASFGLGGGLTFVSTPEPRDLLTALHRNAELRDRVEAVLQAEKKRALEILSGIGVGTIERLAERLFSGDRFSHADLQESFGRFVTSEAEANAAR